MSAKHIIALVLGGLMAFHAAHAQSVGGSYTRVTVDYVNRSIKPKHSSFETYSTNGVGITWMKGIGISRRLPFYVEIGAGLDFGRWSRFGSTYDDECRTSLNTLALNVPVNIAYKFQVGNAVTITPYLGADFRANILARAKEEYDNDSYVWNLFNAGHVGKDNRWTRFQAGWHVGAAFSFNKLYLGINYGTDFINISKDTATSTLIVSMGVALR